MSEQRNELMYVAPPEPPPSRRPPLGTVGVVGWLRQNLFSSWMNAVLTIVTLLAVFVFLQELLTWAIQTADWGVINENIALFNVGRYPDEEMWRIELMAAAMMFLSGIGLAIWGGASRNFFLTTFVVITFMLLLPIAAERLKPASLHFLVEENDVFAPMRFVGDEGDKVTITVLPMNDNLYSQEDEDPVRGLIENAPGATSSRARWSTIKRTVSDALIARVRHLQRLKKAPTLSLNRLLLNNTICCCKSN